MDFLKQLTVTQALGLFWLENLFIAGCVLILGNWLRKKYHQKRLSALVNDATKQEVIAAFISISINSVITFIGYYLWKQAWIKFEMDISIDILLDFVLLILVMDWMMYILHLLVHKTFIYRFIHKLHHNCKNPEPIDLFVLDPFETLAFGALWLMVIFIFPANIYSVIAYLVCNVFFGMMGHIAVEPFPKYWARHPVLKYISTSTFHYQHHNNEHHNFGFYTTIWDTFFNTLSPDYVEKFENAGKIS